MLSSGLRAVVLKTLDPAARRSRLSVRLQSSKARELGTIRRATSARAAIACASGEKGPAVAVRQKEGQLRRPPGSLAKENT